MPNSDLSFKNVAGQVVAEGRIITADDLSRFNKVMKKFPDVLDLTTIAAREVMIDIDVTLVAVTTTNSSSLGLLNFTSTTPITVEGEIPLGKSATSPPNFNVSLSLSSDVLNALNAMLATGQAKIVANPRIVTTDEQPAEIVSGGQIPYPIAGTGGSPGGVTYESYGITLDVTPTLRANDVFMDLSLSASEPGQVDSRGNTPLNQRSIHLRVAVDKNKTLAIAGLMNSMSSGGTTTGCILPLFSTTSTSNKGEIIVLVKPQLAAPDGIGLDNYRTIKPQDIEK
jgi:type II secretory pathway component GspD/PulD (secretin)